MRRLIVFGVLATMSAGAHATLISLGNVTDLGGGAYSLSTGTGAVAAGSIESFLGLSSGGLDPAMGDAIEGSAITESFELSAATLEYSFDWLWNTDESRGPGYNDFAFVYLASPGSQIIESIADTTRPDGASGTVLITATGVGLLTIGIGIMDVGDAALDSTLNVSNIQRSTVPEPSTLALLVLPLLITMLGANKSRRSLSLTR